jgi:hypothetical protein
MDSNINNVKPRTRTERVNNKKKSINNHYAYFKYTGSNER